MIAFIVTRGYGDFGGDGSIALVAVRGYLLVGAPTDTWALVTVDDPGGSWSVDTP